MKKSGLWPDLGIEGQNTLTEVDTGASVSICNREFYNTRLSSLKFLPTKLSLSSYTNEPIIPIRKVKVAVALKKGHTHLWGMVGFSH